MCVASQPAVDFCSKLATLRQFVHYFALQWLPILFFLGQVLNKPLDFANLFRTRQHVSFSDPLVSSPSPSLALPRDGPGTVFLPGEEGFCTPGTRGALTASTNAIPVPSAGTAQEVGPLTSSPPSRGQSSGGALWRAVYAPGDGQTNPAYCSQSVQCSYINEKIKIKIFFCCCP